jgi:hypothetical protein
VVLQQLHIRSMSARGIGNIFTQGQQQQQQTTEHAAAAAVLPQLTQLQLVNLYYGEALPCLSSLARLQKLRVGLSSSESAVNLAHLPSSLTQLEVIAAPSNTFDISSSLTRGFSRLTALRHLQLSRVACVQPLLLCGMTQLTHLQLEVGRCSSVQLHQLLLVLPVMQQLHELRLGSWGCFSGGPAEQPVKAQHLTALLCCRQLSSVVLRDAGHLPAAAGQQLFPPGRQLPHFIIIIMLPIKLPHLKQLVLSYSTAASKEAAAAEGTAPAAAAALGVDDLARLACCCPGLQALELCGVLHRHEGLAAAGAQALSGLVGLTRLQLEPRPFGWPVQRPRVLMPWE